MPSIIDKFLEGGEIRRKREERKEDLELRRQANRRADSLSEINNKDAEIRHQKDKTRRFFGGVNELKLLSDQGDWDGVRRATQNIAQIDPRFVEGSEMIYNQLTNGDFDGVKQSINNSYQLGLDNGLINDPSKGGRTAVGREKERQFKLLQDMPEGDARDEFARLIGAKGKQESLDDKLKFQVGKQTQVGNIKTNQRLIELKRIEAETEEKRSMLELRKITIDETKIKNLNDRQLAIDKKNSGRKEAGNAINLVDNLLKGDSFSSAFGRFNNMPPEGARSQSNIDARAQVDQVTSLISLEAREKLKGQGTITDSETATLAKSATLLANPLISDQLARKELRRVRGIFEDVEDRNRLKRETINQQQNQTGGNQGDVGTLSDEDLFN